MAQPACWQNAQSQQCIGAQCQTWQAEAVSPVQGISEWQPEQQLQWVPAQSQQWQGAVVAGAMMSQPMQQWHPVEQKQIPVMPQAQQWQPAQAQQPQPAQWESVHQQQQQPPFQCSQPAIHQPEAHWQMQPEPQQPTYCVVAVPIDASTCFPQTNMLST